MCVRECVCVCVCVSVRARACVCARGSRRVRPRLVSARTSAHVCVFAPINVVLVCKCIFALLRLMFYQNTGSKTVYAVHV